MRLVVLAGLGGRGIAATDLPKATQVAEVVHALRDVSEGSTAQHIPGLGYCVY
jgi:hypothetical protein